jgi:L-seryl-tRNA(Ser) seleniumtransferase
MFLSGIQQIGESYEAQLIETMSEVGGGSLPLEQLPTWAVTLRSLKMTTQTLTDALRHCQIPVIVRVSEDRLIFDLRTIQEHEAEEILSALRDLA